MVLFIAHFYKSLTIPIEIGYVGGIKGLLYTYRPGLAH